MTMMKRLLSVPLVVLLVLAPVSAEQSVYSDLEALRKGVIQHEENLMSMLPSLSETDAEQADRVVSETNHLLCWLSYWTDLEFLIGRKALSPEEHQVAELLSERREMFGKFLRTTEARMDKLVATFGSPGAALEAAKIRDAIGDSLSLLSGLGNG